MTKDDKSKERIQNTPLETLNGMTFFQIQTQERNERIVREQRRTAFNFRIRELQIDVPEEENEYQTNLTIVGPNQ